MNNRYSLSTGRSLRRTVSLLLVACMMFCLMPLAQATSIMPLKASVYDASGRGGDTVSVAVYVQPGQMSMIDDSFWKYTMKVDYDPAVLTLSGAVTDEADSAVFDTSESVTGSVYVQADTFGSSVFIDSKQKVFTMHFTINPAAAPGDTSITLDGGSFTLDQTPVEIAALSSGKVTVLNDTPAAGSVSIGGTPVVGSTLTGQYAYTDTENNAEGVSTFKWYQASDSAGADKAAIPAATNKTLVPGAELLGKYLFFEVTPVAAGGAATGSPVLSSAAGPVTAAAQTAVVTIGSREGEPGSLVTVPVTLDAASAGVGSYGMRINFDKNALEVFSINGPGTTVFDSTYSNAKGNLRTAWADGSGGDHLLVAGHELFTVTFRIKASATDGVKPLTITDVSDAQQLTLTDTLSVEMNKTLNVGRVNVASRKAPVKEIITVDVQAPGSKDKGPVSKAEIERTAKADGTKSDKVQLTSDQAKQTVESVIAAKLKKADIVIPDTKDEVSEVNVTVPKDSSKLIKDAKIDIGIVTDNVKVNIPNDSLQDFDEELYFHFVPLKSDAEKQEVKERADKEKIVQDAAGSKGVTVVGRPMTIETNLQSRKVELVMPLKGVELSDEEQANLGVYVEHSDGTKELLHGTIVDYAEGAKGLQFSVNKFSTFTLVKLEAQPKPETHSAYINGYEDGTFRPEHAITRAEMATILSRVVNKDAQAADIAYGDVPAGHWAAAAISKVTTMQLMSGYPDGTFAPDQPITRAEMASLVSLMVASDKTGEGFTDIAGHWANAAILKVQGAGVIQGYADGSFKPEQAITRAEAVAIINKMLGRKPSVGHVDLPWKDVAATAWAYADIVEASVDHSFTLGADGSESWVEQP